MALAHTPARLGSAALRQATRHTTRRRGGGEDGSRNTRSYAGVTPFAGSCPVRGEANLGHARGSTPGSHPFAMAVRLSPHGMPWRTQCTERTDCSARLQTGQEA